MAAPVYKLQLKGTCRLGKLKFSHTNNDLLYFPEKEQRFFTNTSVLNLQSCCVLLCAQTQLSAELIAKITKN